MKKTLRITSAVLVMLMLVSAFTVSASAANRPVVSEPLSPPSISAKAACIMDAKTGEVIYAKNEHEKLPMASTTKIMTSLLALENGNIGDDITITKDMLGADGTLLCLQEGWQITLYDLVVGALVVSGNDAADSIAVAVGGTKDNFVSMMNERCAEYGMFDTHFTTPSGLDEFANGEHYSTAYDLCLLAREASKNPDLISITSNVESIIYYGNPKRMYYIYTHNYLLEKSKSANSYPGCDGLKTGYTERAGHCLVTHVKRDGVELVCVTLNAPERFGDHRKLYDYALSLYGNYQIAPEDREQEMYVVGGVEDSVKLTCDADCFAVRNDYVNSVEKRVTLDRFVYAPVEEGQVVGKLEYCCGDTVVASYPLTASKAVEASNESWLSAYVSAIKNKNNGG